MTESLQSLRNAKISAHICCMNIKDLNMVFETIFITSNHLSCHSSCQIINMELDLQQNSSVFPFHKDASTSGVFLHQDSANSLINKVCRTFDIKRQLSSAAPGPAAQAAEKSDPVPNRPQGAESVRVTAPGPRSGHGPGV